MSAHLTLTLTVRRDEKHFISKAAKWHQLLWVPGTTQPRHRQKRTASFCCGKPWRTLYSQHTGVLDHFSNDKIHSEPNWSWPGDGSESSFSGQGFLCWPEETPVRPKASHLNPHIYPCVHLSCFDTVLHPERRVTEDQVWGLQVFGSGLGTPVCSREQGKSVQAGLGWWLQQFPSGVYFATTFIPFPSFYRCYGAIKIKISFQEIIC